MPSFFAGDDIINMRVGILGARPGELYPGMCTVSALRNSLERLAKRIHEIEHVYSGHFVTDLENTAILNTLDACRAICEDPVGNSNFYKETPNGRQYFRFVEGLGVISYREDCV